MQREILDINSQIPM